MHLKQHLIRINDAVRVWAVWILRIAVGSTFIFSGFVKVVDPWGFMYKIQDYLNVWGVHFLWREVIFILAIGISLVEFCAGVMLITGCLRRACVQLMAAMMALMLPLTAYIAIASPVPDCGCFGEALILSNTATFLKNLALSLGIVYLLFNNAKVQCLYPPLIQWMVLVASILYCLVLGIVGMNVQPLVDFRPYKLGERLVEDDDTDLMLIFEKDGQKRTFGVDELPDSTWTYVGRHAIDNVDEKYFAIFDGTDDVTADVLTSDHPQLLLVVSSPDRHQKARAEMANSLNDYMEEHGGEMMAILAMSPDSVAAWKDKVNPQYEVYTADDTMLKELVRGDAALVYLLDGKIKWKRSIYSLPGDFPDFEAEDNQLDTVNAPDDGRALKKLTLIYIAVLFAVFMLGQLSRIRALREEEEKKG